MEKGAVLFRSTFRDIPSSPNNRLHSLNSEMRTNTSFGGGPSSLVFFLQKTLHCKFDSYEIHSKSNKKIRSSWNWPSCLIFKYHSFTYRLKSPLKKDPKRQINYKSGPYGYLLLLYLTEVSTPLTFL